MFSVAQKRAIADAVQRILRDTQHPELPAGEIAFALHVDGAEAWSWADIQNNGAVTRPSINPWNEAQDPVGETPAPPPADLVALVQDLQAHAKECGWQDEDEPIAALLAWTPAAPPVPPTREKPQKSSLWAVEFRLAEGWHLNEVSCVGRVDAERKMVAAKARTPQYEFRLVEYVAAPTSPVRASPTPHPTAVWIVADHPRGGVRGVYHTQAQAEAGIAEIRSYHEDLTRSDFTVQAERIRGAAPEPAAMPPVEVGDVVCWTGRDGTERSEVIDQQICGWTNQILHRANFHAIERDGRVIWRRTDRKEPTT